MKEKSFTDIADRLRGYKFNGNFDLVVGIADGGIVPAYMIAHLLKLPLEFLQINFRDGKNDPQRESPQLLKPVTFEFAGKSILLVDDRVNSGKTLELAKKILTDATSIKTFAVNGKADFFLYDEECFEHPWDI